MLRRVVACSVAFCCVALCSVVLRRHIVLCSLCYVTLCFTWVRLCYVMVYYDMVCYVMLCYVMLCYVMLCYVMLCYVMLCYVMLCYVMLCYVMLCYVMLCYVMLCYVMLCYARSCHVMSFHVMFCSVLICYVMLCYVMLLHRRGLRKGLEGAAVLGALAGCSGGIGVPCFIEEACVRAWRGSCGLAALAGRSGLAFLENALAGCAVAGCCSGLSGQQEARKRRVALASLQNGVCCGGVALAGCGRMLWRGGQLPNEGDPRNTETIEKQVFS